MIKVETLMHRVYDLRKEVISMILSYELELHNLIIQANNELISSEERTEYINKATEYSVELSTLRDFADGCLVRILDDFEVHSEAEINKCFRTLEKLSKANIEDSKKLIDEKMFKINEELQQKNNELARLMSQKAEIGG